MTKCAISDRAMLLRGWQTQHRGGVFGMFNQKPGKGQNQEISQRRQTEPDRASVQSSNRETGRGSGRQDQADRIKRRPES